MKAWHVILILVLYAISFWGGYHIRGTWVKNEQVKTDTFIKVDTVKELVPYPVFETVIQDVPEMFPMYITQKGDTVRESIYVSVPITRKEYKTSDYHLWISGYNPTLDNIEIYRRTEYVTKTVYPRRWGLGVIAGYGVGKHGLSPYVGIGGYYRIW